MAAGSARPVRVARPRPAPGLRPVRVATTPVARTGSRDGGGSVERRENRAATHRAVRLSILYAAGIAAVYAGLVALARAGPAGGSSGTADDVALAGAVAVGLAAVGVLVALGAAPRAVELRDVSTIVVGRFGGRYRFPPVADLRTTVLRRFPAGPLSPVALESVEIAGGSTRRAFLLDEHLLDPPGRPSREASEPAD